MGSDSMNGESTDSFIKPKPAPEPKKKKLKKPKT